VEKFGGVGRVSLDAEKYVEGSGASGGGRHEFQIVGFLKVLTTEDVEDAELAALA